MCKSEGTTGMGAIKAAMVYFVLKSAYPVLAFLSEA